MLTPRCRFTQAKRDKTSPADDTRISALGSTMCYKLCQYEYEFDMFGYRSLLVSLLGQRNLNEEIKNRERYLLLITFVGVAANLTRSLVQYSL